ncbi:MAG: DUF3800 domain-containing protein [Clostridia bacterium]|nr:DUF3800 domain-containing protein [Clostridia bacterium]
MEYVIYCDESLDKGTLYSDFFGGCILPFQYLEEITTALNNKKTELNLLREVKWIKVTPNYLEKYEELIHLFFDFIRAGKIRFRIMFRETSSAPIDKNRDKYFKLYYQFLKHSFGLRTTPEECFVRIYLDELPDTREKRERFKDYLLNLPNTRDYAGSRVHIRREDIAEVCSHDHVILQCTDIILGAMQFRMNDLHLVKPDGARTRGKRTIAKEKLYKYINQEIQTMLPAFNIKMSTGFRGFENPHWESPYEHWLFESSHDFRGQGGEGTD